jgi:hypothetical protein
MLIVNLRLIQRAFSIRHCDAERSEAEAIQRQLQRLDCFGGCAASQ